MSSRTATVLVIFIVAIVAFCLASVFAAMTGPISILPNETESGGVLDNLSAITDNSDDNNEVYGYQDYNDYSSSDDSSSDDSQVETTTDTSTSSSSSGSQSSTSTVETTTDSSSSNPGSDSSSTQDSGSNVETTSV